MATIIFNELESERLTVSLGKSTRLIRNHLNSKTPKLSSMQMKPSDRSVFFFTSITSSLFELIADLENDINCINEMKNTMIKIERTNSSIAESLYQGNLR